ncbi:FAD-linked oxidoreductase pynB [Aplysia californica]|uniref:FAD-linked oxidoreductase pynB n=1 Tax=Aplysia californica TaxID=6500 RepID=A0ABM1A5R0_APLCA|nr:FAD-linked oxidoreductase pynB [Aplysia californica]
MTGGLGPLSRTLGLAADSLQSARMVLADGRLATVSAGGVTVTDADGEVKTYEDYDLIRALRGGGITWGVPVSFTFSLTPTPVQFASLTASYLIVDNGQVTGRSTLRSILGQMASLNVQWGGYISIDGAPSNSFPNDRGEIKYHLFSYGQYVQNPNFNTAIENLRNIPTSLNGQVPVITTLSTLRQYRNDVAEVEQHFTSKKNTYVMNTLLNADVITDPNKLDQFVELMMDVVNSPTVTSNYRCVGKLAGGKVGSPNSNTYVSEKMRDALFSWTCALSWDEGITREAYYIDQALAFQKRLRALGNGGVDPYYASEDLEDWRTALYGSSYYELLNIKKTWDVDNYLWAHNAVASDFELSCNNIRCPHRH